MRTPFDRYLKVVRWAESRYRTEDRIVLERRRAPTRYSKIETAAYQRLLREVDHDKLA
jgi:hypothetical protein